MNRDQRRLLRELQGSADRDAAVRYRVAKVKTTSPFVITLAGADISPNRLTSYTPVVNDAVAVLQTEGSILVLGKVT